MMSLKSFSLVLFSGAPLGGREELPAADVDQFFNGMGFFQQKSAFAGKVDVMLTLLLIVATVVFIDYFFFYL